MSNGVGEQQLQLALSYQAIFLESMHCVELLLMLVLGNDEEAYVVVSNGL